MVGFGGAPRCVCKAEAMFGALAVDGFDARFCFFCIEAIAIHNVVDANFQWGMNEHGKHVLSAPQDGASATPYDNAGSLVCQFGDSTCLRKPHVVHLLRLSANAAVVLHVEVV